MIANREYVNKAGVTDPFFQLQLQNVLTAVAERCETLNPMWSDLEPLVARDYMTGPVGPVASLAHNPHSLSG
jgi:hypothetical protein